jgi:drug/metabolite transporter (DMT)-like permease
VGGVAVVYGLSLGTPVPLLSLLAVLGGVLCFAQGTVVLRRYSDVHPVTMNALGMAVAAIVLVAASLIVGEPRVLPRRVETWIALGYLVVIGSIVVFVLYMFVVQQWNASRASYAFVITPVVTVLLSAWLDDEPIGIGLVLGGLLILAGVYVGALRPANVEAEGARR